MYSYEEDEHFFTSVTLQKTFVEENTVNYIMLLNNNKTLKSACRKLTISIQDNGEWKYSDFVEMADVITIGSYEEMALKYINPFAFSAVFNEPFTDGKPEKHFLEWGPLIIFDSCVRSEMIPDFEDTAEGYQKMNKWIEDFDWTTYEDGYKDENEIVDAKTVESIIQRHFHVDADDIRENARMDNYGNYDLKGDLGGVGLGGTVTYSEINGDMLTLITDWNTNFNEAPVCQRTITEIQLVDDKTWYYISNKVVKFEQ